MYITQKRIESCPKLLRAASEDAIYLIRPDRIQLNYLDRPGTESWVNPPGDSMLKEIQKYFSEGGIPVDIIGLDYQIPLLSPDDNSIALIDETLRRRPCTAEDIALMTGLTAPEVRKKLAVMVQEGIVQAKSGERGIFYWINTGVCKFVDDTHKSFFYIPIRINRIMPPTKKAAHTITKTDFTSPENPSSR